MALTIIEAAKLMTGEVLRPAVINVFADTTDLLRIMQFQNIAGNALRYNKEGALPGVGFRSINEAFVESTGVLNPEIDSILIAGGDIDVDKFLIDTQGEDQRASQARMKMKALAHKISETFIKGDSAANPETFDGLQVRLGGDQVISNEVAADGAALSLANLDAAIDAVDSPTHLLMTKQMKRRLAAAQRDTAVGGFVTYGQDEFGKRVQFYNELPIAVADGNGDANPAIDNAEAYSGGGAADGTSIYILSIGDGMFTGLQNGPMQVRNLGELQEKPAIRTRVEWYIGCTVQHPRAASRLRDIDGALAIVP